MDFFQSITSYSLKETTFSLFLFLLDISPGLSVVYSAIAITVPAAEDV